MFAKNFNKTGAFKAIKAYEDDITIQTMAYAQVIREHWERGGKEHNLCRCKLEILCPFKKMVEVYQSIVDEENFLNNSKMAGCLKNFVNSSGKRSDVSYINKDIINNYGIIFLEFEYYCISSPLTNQELLEIIENSYKNVAEAIWEKHRDYLKEKLKNKKVELFDKLLDKKVLINSDIEQIGKLYNKYSNELNEELNKYSNELNEELMKSYEALLKKSGEKIQVVQALKE